MKESKSSVVCKREINWCRVVGKFFLRSGDLRFLDCADSGTINLKMISVGGALDLDRRTDRQRQAGGRADRQKDRHTQTDGQRQTGRRAGRQTEAGGGGQASRGRQTDRHRQTDGQKQASRAACRRTDSR